MTDSYTREELDEFEFHTLKKKGIHHVSIEDVRRLIATAREAMDENTRYARMAQRIADFCTPRGWSHCTTEKEFLEQVESIEADAARLTVNLAEAAQNLISQTARAEQRGRVKGLSYTYLVEAEDDGTFLAEILEFPGCIATGETPTAALSQLKDAALSWLKAAEELGRTAPEPLPAAEIEKEMKVVDKVEIGRCKNCRHFRQRDGRPDDKPCRSEHVQYGYGIKYSGGAEVVIEADEGWGWMIGPDFGCVHWEAVEGG